jgi:hypothetical protein
MASNTAPGPFKAFKRFDELTMSRFNFKNYAPLKTLAQEPVQYFHGRKPAARNDHHLKILVGYLVVLRIRKR